jgi:hypothetical protein
MAEISKQALKVANNTEFPNNNAGAITPSRLRGFNTDMIDSLVDEISYTADSASWEQSIAALEAFTGSATGLTSASLLITASANLNTITFTKGNGSTFNVLVDTGSAAPTDISALNAFTASIAGTNAFTQSANARLNSLESTTSSLNNSVSNLNGFTQSIQNEVNGLEAKTGSYATTGSNVFVGNQTIVGSVSASSFVSASKFIGDGSQITGITASVATTILDDGILQGTATSLNFTGSGISATVVAGVAIIEANVDLTTLGRYTLTSSFNAYTQSTDAKINSINGFTASLAGTNAFTASIAGTNAFTQSINSRVSGLEAATASYANSASVAAVDLAQQNQINSLIQFTSSVTPTNISALNAFTASIAGTNAFTQSANARLNSIESKSGSWVTSAITASSIVTASVNLNTITFTKGDASTFNITVNTGSGGAATNTGSLLVTASFDNGTRNLTFTKGDASTFNVNIPDASGSILPNGVISGSAQITQLGFVSSSVTASSLVTASVLGQVLTFTKGDASSFTVNLPGGGSQTYITGSFGAFHDETTQSGSADTPNVVRLSNTDLSQDVFLSGSTAIKVTSAGVYNLQFSAQAKRVTGSGTDALDIWFRKNGSDIPWSNTTIGLDGGVEATRVVPAWNYMDFLNANDYLEIVWQATDANVQLISVPASGSLPAIPSVIATLTRVDVGGGNNMVTTASFNAYTASNDQKVNTLIAATGSFATTGSNTFIGTQTISGSILIASGSNITLADDGTIVGGNVNGIGAIELIPTASQLSTDKIVIYNDYTGLQNTQYGITIVNTGLSYANGVSASFSVTSSNNASSTLNWWYGGGSGFGVISPENGTVSLDSNGEGSFAFVVDDDSVPFVIYVSSETEFTNPYANQNGASSLIINGSQYQGIYNVNVTTGDLQQTSIVLGNTEHGIRTNTDGGVTLTSYDYVNNQNYTLNLKNNVLKLDGSEFVNNTDLFIKAGDDLFLDAEGDDVDIRPANEVRVRVGYDFTNNTQQSTFVFVPGASTDDGYLRFPDGTEQYTAFSTASLATTGSNTFSGSQIITGSVQGNVVAMSISSNTASMDFNDGNFFTLTLASGSVPTFINPTNIKPGQTISLVVTQASTLSGSLVFPSTFKFPSGSSYVPSALTSSKDIVTFITVDDTTIFASSVKNLI